MNTSLRCSLAVGLATALVLAGCTSPPASSSPQSAAAPTAEAAPNRVEKRASAQRLDIHLIDIGQGDCILVVFPSGKRMVVDCGSKTSGVDLVRVRNLIKDHCADPANPSIDMLVITHPDDDHYSAITRVFGDRSQPQISVRHVTYVGTPGEHAVNGHGLPAWLSSFKPTEATAIDDDSWNRGTPTPLPGFEHDGVAVLAANVPDLPPVDSNKDNARSIVLMLSLGTGRAMLAGDATDDTDTFIKKRFQGNLQALDVDFWKAAHHGATDTATPGQGWASVIRPEIIAFTCGSNTYGHPSVTLAENYVNFVSTAPLHPLVLWQGRAKILTPTETLKYQNKAFYSTESYGDITITSTGGPFTLAGVSRQ
jgi:competence protein ComEC